MKLKDLLSSLSYTETVDFEIIETTYPEEILPRNILKKYPYAADYEVKLISPTMGVDKWGSYVPSLLIEVTNGGNN